MNPTRIALIVMLLFASLAFVPSASAEIYWCGTGAGSDRPTHCCRHAGEESLCNEAVGEASDAVRRASATADCYVNTWEPFPIGSGISGALNCAFSPN